LFLLGEREDWGEKKKDENGNRFFQRQRSLRVLSARGRRMSEGIGYDEKREG
jgi:hypothetical protein